MQYVHRHRSQILFVQCMYSVSSVGLFLSRYWAWQGFQIAAHDCSNTGPVPKARGQIQFLAALGTWRVPEKIAGTGVEEWNAGMRWVHPCGGFTSPERPVRRTPIGPQINRAVHEPRHGGVEWNGRATSTAAFRAFLLKTFPPPISPSKRHRRHNKP